MLIHLIPDAPVTVSEQDTSENNAEDNQDEHEDTGGGKKKLFRCVVKPFTLNYTYAGVPSHQGKKRKRYTPPSSPVQPAIEAEDDIVDDIVLPRIHGQTNWDNRHQTPSTCANLPASPHHSPSLPTAIPDIEDKTFKHNKPKSKLTTKALQTAKAEVC